MAIYLIDADNPFVGTQGEIPKGQEVRAIDIPNRKPELLAFLNEMASFFRGSPTEEPVPTELPEPVASPSHSEQLLSFEDEWDRFPLARKAHFAALFCEEARSALKPKEDTS